MRADTAEERVGYAQREDDGAQLLFRLASVYERRFLGIGWNWPFKQWVRFLPEHTQRQSG